MYQKKLIFTLLILALNIITKAQEITGTITNMEGEIVPYATIYIEELQTGTSANSVGQYSVNVSEGTFTLTFRSLGYSPTIKKVKVNENDVKLDVALGIQSYILDGVTVRADNEDPAYSIMRKAIARVPAFVNQIKSYKSEVYIKAAMKFDKIPRLIRKRMEINGEKPIENKTYVNESINKIYFTAPDKYKQEVVSVNNSFPISEDNIPVIGLITSSVYLSIDDFYISPFAPNSFSHYKFRHEGMLQDGALFINKIKVIPKRKSKLLVSGYLYIIEDIWCVYSYDLTIHPLFSTISAKQHFAPIKGNNYMPVNMFAKASFKAMGVKARGTYTTTIKYKDIKTNNRFANKKVQYDYLTQVNKKGKEEKKKKPKTKKEIEHHKLETEITDLINKQDLSNRDMSKLQRLMSKKASFEKVKDDNGSLEIKSNYNIINNKNTLVRDSIYWDSIRPIPATAEEKISYQKVEEKKQKQDSTSTFKKAMKTIFFGNSSWVPKKRTHFHYGGLLSLKNVGFHPTSGLEVMQNFSLRSELDTIKKINLHISGNGGYYIGRKEFFGHMNAGVQYNNLKRAGISFNAEYMLRNFNNMSINPFTERMFNNLNTIYNLFFKENYIKKYHSTRFSLTNRIEIINGLMSWAEVSWRDAKPIENCTNFSFLFRKKDYEANIPINKTINEKNLSSKKEFNIALGFSHTPKQYYRISKNSNYKYPVKSKYPTYGFNYKTAIKLNSDYSNFHHLEVFIKQHLDIYTTSSFDYNLKAGYFFQNNDLHFSSFKHFKTMPEYFSVRNLDNAFMLLNNYEYSTADAYAEAHLKYSNDFLLLKHLPFISNTMLRENLYLNSLFVKKHIAYNELGYSISRILASGEIGIFVGFKGIKFHQVGVRGRFAF